MSAPDAIVGLLSRFVVPLVGSLAKPISELHVAIGDVRHGLLKNTEFQGAKTPDESTRWLMETAHRLLVSSDAIHGYGVFAARGLVPPRTNVRSAWRTLLKLSSAIHHQDTVQAANLRAAVEAALELHLYVQPTYAAVADELWQRLWRRRSSRLGTAAGI